MSIERARACRKAIISLLFVGFPFVGLAGCDVPPDDLDPAVEVTQGALTVLPGEFSRNTPTHFMQEGIDFLAMLNGNGYNAFDTITYSHSGAADPDEWGQYEVEAFPYLKSSYRPFIFWENASIQSTTILASDMNRAEAVRDLMMERSNNPSASLVNPAFSSVTVLGPTVALGDMHDDGTCAFTLYGTSAGRVIAQACLQGNGSNLNFWEDWGLDLPPLPPAAPTPRPNLSPMAFRRSPAGAAGSDSLFYPCGSGATQVCEYRLGGAGNTKTFTTTFGSGAFMASTRPTALSHGYTAPLTDNAFDFTIATPERWMFAAKLDGSVRSIVARRETSAVDSGTQPTYLDSHGTDLILPIESTTANVTYSTPMPYIRSDLKVGVVYYRTEPGLTTRVMESVCSPSGTGTPKMDSTCTAPVAIYDVGVQIPAGNEPMPFVEVRPGDSATATGRNTIIIRLPYNGGVNDVGRLQRGTGASDGYTKVMLPPYFFDAGSNLVSQPSAFDQSAWTKLNVANPMAAANINTRATLAPNTTYTAELLRETTAAGTHGVSQSGYADNRTSIYRWTAYLRAETRAAARLVMDSTDDPSSAVSVSVDLTAGTITATSATGNATYVNSTIESMGSKTGAKWYRVSVSGKPTTVVGMHNITGKILMLSGGNSSYTGNAANGLFVWGAELMVYEQTPPAAPTGLGATAGNAQVALSWTASAGAASYNVYRGTSAGGEAAAAIATGVTATTYTNTGLTNGTKYYYKVAAVNPTGTSAQSSEASATPSAANVKVNCGDNGAFSPFVADAFFTGGATKTRAVTIDVSGVVEPAPADVYKSQRYSSPFSYTIPGFVAGSSHKVRLHFAETNPANNAANKRKFSVAINGTTQISSLDLFATVGAINKAYIKEFTLPADASGRYVISFTTNLDSATVSAIEVR